MQYGIRPEGPEYYAHLGLAGTLFHVPGATRLALAPGFHIPRLWRCISHQKTVDSISHLV
jgi:hypothetical protein